LPYDINNPSGEVVTFGNTYIEKLFVLDGEPETFFGIYLCNDWSQIKGKKGDNLLANMEFYIFMSTKYGDDKAWAGAMEIVSFTGKKNVALNNIKTSDIIEFCKTYGRPHINIVDNSCTVIGVAEGRTIGKRNLAKLVKKIDPNTMVGGINKKTTRKSKQFKKKKKRKTKRKKSSIYAFSK
jgi:hypothetical protein